MREILRIIQGLLPKDPNDLLILVLAFVVVIIIFTMFSAFRNPRK